MRGHITKRGDTWTAVVDLPADPVTGKRRQKRITTRTKREAELQVAALVQATETGYTDAGKMLVRDYLDRWLQSAAPSLRDSTVRRYRDLINLHIKPVIGGHRLSKLTAADVQRLYADRLELGLSPTSVRHVHGVLHRALDQAVRWGLLNRNVSDVVDLPRRSTPEAKAWNASEAATFLAAAADDELEALWRLALLAGMRRGEILGLLWKDVDLDRGSLSVRRTLSRGSDSRLVAGEPKTQKGKRQIALPPSVIESLRRHRVKQLEHRLAIGPAYEDQDLVFTNATGNALHPNTVAKRFRVLTATAGLSQIRFHDLRHTCATLLLANGVHPKIVQERLGHADIAMTMNLYSHVTASMQRQAADRLDVLLESVTSETA